MFDIIIVGAGGFGRELFTLLWDSVSRDDFQFKGFLGELDSTHADAGSSVIPIADPRDYEPAKNDRFLLAIGDIEARRSVVESLVGKGGVFISMIHPTAVVAETAKIGVGAVVYPMAVISNDAKLDSYVHLSNYASVGHDASVGEFCLLAPYATLNGFSSLASDVYMSTHSTVVPETHVGRGSKISANSVVTHDIPEYSFVHGVPGTCTRRVWAPRSA